MKQVTPYERFVRTKRMEKGRLLVEQAIFMDCTASLLSTVELGRKPVPANWIPIITNFLDLDDEDQSKLRTVVEKSNVEFRMRPRADERNNALAASKKLQTLRDRRAQRKTRSGISQIGEWRNCCSMHRTTVVATVLKMTNRSTLSDTLSMICC